LNEKHQTEGQSEMECHSPGAMSWGGTLEDSGDDGKPPAKKNSNPENVKARSSKRKIDQVLEGTGTLFMEGTGKEEEEDFKQLAKVNKQLGQSFESASGISEMTSGSGPTLPIQSFPPVATMNQVAVTAAASSKRKIAAASRKKTGTSKKAVALVDNENIIAPGSNSNTRQITLTQMNYPSPPVRVSAISTVQHLLPDNKYPERTVEEFYASKKSHRGAVVQYAAQLEALMALLHDIMNNCNLRAKPDRTLWLDELKKDKPTAKKLAFWILCFTSLMGQISDALLRKYVVPVLTRIDFSVKLLANNSVEYIESLLNVFGKKAVFAKILKDVAVSIQDDHNGIVPDNLHDLLSIPSLKPCSARLTLQYAFNQLDVSIVMMS